MPAVRFATSREYPRLHEDDHPLLELLEKRWLDFDCAVWDDPKVDWSDARVTIIRSTWDYVPKRAQFLEWAAKVASVSKLLNPRKVVEWNTDKRYLSDLDAARVPTVPTVFVAAGAPASFDEIAKQKKWKRMVLKPAVGAGGADAVLVSADEPGGQAHLERLAMKGTVIVQPYLESVETHGERSMIFLGGALTHSVRKQPAFRPKTAEADPATFDARERAAAQNAYAFATRRFGDLLYARVDLVPDEKGELLVMELELTEPTLFFREGGLAATTAMAEAIEEAL